MATSAVRPQARAVIEADLRRTIDATHRRRSTARLVAALRQGCWIYGGGLYGRLLYRQLASRGLICHGFVDIRAENGSFARSLPALVVHPAQFDSSAAAGQTLVVALHNFATDQAPVVAWGRRSGFAEVVIPAELPDLLGPDVGSYWLVGREHTAEHLGHVLDLIEDLADPISVETVVRLARFRISGDIVDHPASDLSDQYFPRDLDFAAGSIRLVDGGAYNGDVLEAARAAGVVIDEWHAFEPDQANFLALADNAAKAPTVRSSLYPCGLGDSFQQLRFASGRDAGSRADPNCDSDTLVQVVPLDMVLPALSPTHVKLDIEGYERQALAGMRQMLSRAAPRLAISIYHQPNDLWELPALVRQLMPNAGLHIRQHGYNGFDTVLYAIPPAD